MTLEPGKIDIVVFLPPRSKLRNSLFPKDYLHNPIDAKKIKSC